MVTVKAQKTTISIPPKLSGTELHDAIATVTNGGGRDVQLAAGSLVSVTPRDLCGLRALVEQAAGCAEQVYFDCPVAPDVHHYLTRMGFYADLQSNVALSVDPPWFQSNDLDRSLIELSHIHCVEDVEQLALRVRRVAETQFGPGTAANACAIAVAAATENVLDHAQSPVGALVAAQRDPELGELELAVVDLGLGIPATLTVNPRYADLSDLDAVERSLEIDVTGTGEVGRGQGLPELVDAVRRAGRSTLTIQSGRAHVTVASASEPNQLLTPSRRCRAPGSLSPSSPRSETMTQGPTMEAHEPTLMLIISNQHFEVHVHEMTGAQLKALAGIPADNLLFREVPGPGDDELIQNDALVHLHNDEHFYDMPPGNFGRV